MRNTNEGFSFVIPCKCLVNSRMRNDEIKSIAISINHMNCWPQTYPPRTTKFNWCVEIHIPKNGHHITLTILNCIDQFRLPFDCEMAKRKRKKIETAKEYSVVFILNTPRMIMIIIIIIVARWKIVRLGEWRAESACIFGYLLSNNNIFVL